MAWVAVILTILSLVFLIRSEEMPLHRTRTHLSNSYRFTVLVRHLISINNLLQGFREHASLCLYLTWNWQLHIDIGINGGINDGGNWRQWVSFVDHWTHKEWQDNERNSWMLSTVLELQDQLFGLVYFSIFVVPSHNSEGFTIYFLSMLALPICVLPFVTF